MDYDYGKAFRVIRAAFGLKQAQLADRVHITASHLSLIESGERQPSLRVINAFANAVGVPPPLISLLASRPEDVNSHSDKNITDLSHMLLRVLVSAKKDPQRPLDLGS
jgi:transcriptional regulator with XRE-family HTH domain